MIYDFCYHRCNFYSEFCINGSIFLFQKLAGDWIRTNTPLLKADFESTASTISPHRHREEIITQLSLIINIANTR